MVYHLPSYFHLSNSSDVDLQTHKIAVWIVLVGAKTQRQHNFSILSDHHEKHSVHHKSKPHFQLYHLEKQWYLFYKIITICPGRC